MSLPFAFVGPRPTRAGASEGKVAKWVVRDRCGHADRVFVAEGRTETVQAFPGESVRFAAGPDRFEGSLAQFALLHRQGHHAVCEPLRSRLKPEGMATLTLRSHVLRCLLGAGDAS